MFLAIDSPRAYPGKLAADLQQIRNKNPEVPRRRLQRARPVARTKCPLCQVTAVEQLASRHHIDASQPAEQPFFSPFRFTVFWGHGLREASADDRRRYLGPI